MNSKHRIIALIVGTMVPAICAAEVYGRTTAETPITKTPFLIMALVVLVAMTCITMLRIHRALHVCFVWATSLFCLCYLTMLRETPMIYYGFNGTSYPARPLTGAPVGGALLGTAAVGLAFAVYSTIRSRKYYDDAAVRTLLGPLPFAVVVGLSFLAKEVFHNSEYWRMTRNAWEWVAFRILLGPAVLAAIVATTEVRMRILRRSHS